MLIHIHLSVEIRVTQYSFTNLFTQNGMKVYRMVTMIISRVLDNVAAQ